MPLFEILFDKAQGFKAGDVVSEERLQNANVKYLLKVGAIKVSTATEEAIAQEVNLQEMAFEMADLRSQVTELAADKEDLNKQLDAANKKIADLEKAAKTTK